MTNPMPRLSCVIFDVDGTLTRTNELIFATFNHLAENYLGRKFSPREIIALFGPPEEGALEKVFGPERLRHLMDELCEYYRSHHATMADIHPGIDRVLGFLKKHKILLAVFTGKGKRTADITLEALGLARFFDLVVSGNDVTNHKPHPEGILKVIDAFSLTPDQVLMVGDSLSDVRASRAAGVKVAAVLWDSYDRERVLAAKSDFVFHTVDEMMQWFQATIH